MRWVLCRWWCSVGGGLWAAGGVGSGRAQGFDGCLSRSGARTQRRFVEARFGLECCGGCWVGGWAGGWVGGRCCSFVGEGRGSAGGSSRPQASGVRVLSGRPRPAPLHGRRAVGWQVVVGPGWVGGGGRCFFLGAGASSKMQGPWRLCSDRASTPGGASLMQGLFGISWWVDELTG